MFVLNKYIIWNIMSFINEPTKYKTIFSQIILKQLKQYHLKKLLILSLKPGNKFVCLDLDDSPCLNCYHYGMLNNNGACLNHYGEYPTILITFEYYKIHSALTENYNETWEEFKIRIDIEKQYYQDYQEKRLKELDEYYYKERINRFQQVIEHPENFQDRFIYILLKDIKKKLHSELYKSIQKIL